MRRIKTKRGAVLKTTPVFDTYWEFATKRQEIFMKRVAGECPPWTNDPIIKNYRFTNVYRASDRVSQYLIRNVIYNGSQNLEDIFFRTILFKVFNKIETWENIENFVGEITWKNYNFKSYCRVLEQQKKGKSPIYSGAYIMPSPDFGLPKKYRNHLRLIEFMIKDFAPKKISKAKSLEEVYKILYSYPSLGSFLAFQFAIDLNYSEIINFSEMDFVVAGPGARNGIQKCFLDFGGLTHEEIIMEVTERSTEEFSRLNLKFRNLWGRELHPIDCQNLFCEVDKYSRVAHPDFLGETDRKKIKQKYKKNLGKIPQWYPPKWNVKVL